MGNRKNDFIEELENKSDFDYINLEKLLKVFKDFKIESNIIYFIKSNKDLINVRSFINAIK